MTMTRRAVLMTSAAIAANVVRPELSFAQETPRKGGVFTVHYGAEQRQLNPSLQASTGVYIIGGKIQEPLVDLDARNPGAGSLTRTSFCTSRRSTTTVRPRSASSRHPRAALWPSTWCIASWRCTLCVAWPRRRVALAR